MAVGSYPIAVNPVTGELTYDPLSSIDTVDVLTAGEVVPGRRFLTSQSVSAASGTLLLGYFTANKTETITTLTAYTGATAAAATPTLCRMGIYSVDANNNLTLAASIPTDTTLFAATLTAYPRTLSASLSKTRGARYATALLVVSGVAVPNFLGLQLVSQSYVNTLVQLDPPIIGRLTSQTDLPASITAGSVVGIQGIPAIRLS